MKKITNFPKFVHIVFTTFFRPQFFQRILLQTTHKGAYLFGNIRRKYSFCGMLLFALLGTLQINAQCNPPTDVERNNSLSVSFSSATANSITLTIPGFSAQKAGYAMYMSNVNQPTTPPRVITKNNNGANTTYSGSGVQLVSAAGHQTSPINVTVTGLTQNATYYFWVYMTKRCDLGDQTSGTVPLYDGDFIVHPSPVTIQAIANTTQSKSLLSIPSISLGNNTNFRLRAGINTSQTISYSIQGNANGFSLSGSTLTPSTALGNSVTIKATAAAGGGFPEITKDFVVRRIKPRSIYYVDRLRLLRKETAYRISTVTTRTNSELAVLCRIGDYIYAPILFTNKFLRISRIDDTVTEMTIPSGWNKVFLLNDRFYEFDGNLWGVVQDNTIFKANINGTTPTLVRSFNEAGGLYNDNLKFLNDKVYGFFRYSPFTAPNPTYLGYFFRFDKNGGGYTKLYEVPRLHNQGTVDFNPSNRHNAYGGTGLVGNKIQLALMSGNTSYVLRFTPPPNTGSGLGTINLIDSGSPISPISNIGLTGYSDETANGRTYYSAAATGVGNHYAGATLEQTQGSNTTFVTRRYKFPNEYFFPKSKFSYFGGSLYITGAHQVNNGPGDVTDGLHIIKLDADVPGSDGTSITPVKLVFTQPNINLTETAGGALSTSSTWGFADILVDGGNYAPGFLFNDISLEPGQSHSVVLDAQTPSDGTITYSLLGSSVSGVSLSGNTLTVSSSVALGTTINVRASITKSSDDVYNAGTKDIAVKVKLSQTISFGAISSKPLAATTFTLHATSSSGSAVTYSSSDETVATINNSVTPRVVTMLKAGSVNITASVAESTNYLKPADVVQPVTIVAAGTKGNQTIHFGSLAAKTYGDSTFNLTGVSDAGIAVSYVSSNTDVATISGNTVTIVGVGSTNITASALENTNYNVAPTVQRGLTVNKRAITITPDANQRKDLGDVDPALSYTVTTGSLVSGDTFSNSFTGGLSRAAGEAIGSSYAINLGTLASAKYAITLASTVVNFQISKGAGQILWDGSAGTTWGTGSNWEGNSAPSDNTDVVIPNVTNAPSIASGVNARMRKLGIQTSATLNVDKQGSIRLFGDLNNLGTLNLQSDGTHSSALIVEGTSNGMVTYERGGFQAPNNGVLEWSIVSPPVAGQTISSFVNTASNMIAKNSGNTHWAVAKFDYSQPAGQHWRYYTVAELDPSTGSKRTETFQIGESYAMARTAAGSVQFTGTIEVANVNKAVTADSWNTLGNPYTAFIPGASGGDNNNFVKDNESVFRTQNRAVYVWKNLATTSEVGVARYEPISLSQSVSLTPGQGFIIRTKPSGTSQSVTFNRSRRDVQPASGSGFNRISNTIPRIELKATLNGLTIHTDVEYFKDFTLALDPGYDVADFGPDRFDLYTKLLDGYENENFAIQALPANNYQNMVIPIGLIADSGSQITFSAEVLNLPAGIEAYLEDRALGTFTNLSKQNASYMVTLNTKVNGHGRFYLRTMSSSLSNGDNPELLGVKVYTTDANTLMIQGIDSEEARMEMYSVIGTQVLDTKFRGTGVNQIKLPNLASGIYIVRLATEKGTIQKKIVLE